jgi:hypothetical protein
MRIVADLVCFHCGHVSGLVEGEFNEPACTGPRFRPLSISGTGATAEPCTRAHMRCRRCGGPVCLDAARVIRFQAMDPPEERPRRGRPRKVSAA